MSQIQQLHQQAMDLAEMAEVAKLRGDPIKAKELFKEAFVKETEAASLLLNNIEVEPARSILHRSAASLAIDCGEINAAERLIAIALSGNPPQEIADELKDLLVQIKI